MDKTTIIFIGAILLSLIVVPQLSSVAYTTYSADRTINADVSKENSGILNISNEANSIKQGASGATLVNVTNPLTRTQNNTVKLSDETTWHLSSTGTDKKTVTLSSGESQTYKVDVGSSATTGNATYWIIARDGVYTFNQSRQVKIKSSSSSGCSNTDYTNYKMIDSFEDTDWCEYDVVNGDLGFVDYYNTHGTYATQSSTENSKIISVHDGTDDLRHYPNDGTNFTVHISEVSVVCKCKNVYIFGYNSSTGSYYGVTYWQDEDIYGNTISHAEILYYDGSSYTVFAQKDDIADFDKLWMTVEWDNYGQRAAIKYTMRSGSNTVTMSTRVNKESLNNRSLRTPKSYGFKYGYQTATDELKIQGQLSFGTLMLESVSDGDLNEWDGAISTTSKGYSGDGLVLADFASYYNRTHVESPGAPNVGDTVVFYGKERTKGKGESKGVVRYDVPKGSNESFELVYSESSIAVMESQSGTVLKSKSINPSGYYRIEAELVDVDTIRVEVSDGGTQLTEFTVTGADVVMNDKFTKSGFYAFRTTTDQDVYMDQLKIINSTSRDFN